MTSRWVLFFVALLGASITFAANKDMGPPAPVAAKYWAGEAFHPGTTTIVGSYTSIVRVEDDAGARYVAFNNSVEGDLSGGLVMWDGPATLDQAPQQFTSRGVVFEHRDINDVFIKGELFAKRRLTRPFITWDKDQGYIGIVHVCADYAPVDSRVYPALVTSRTGAPGSWTYHGKLKGEIWDEFGDESGKPKWADGGGFFFNPAGPSEIDRARPMSNRYLFFSNQYAGPGGIALLMSANGKEWVFHRDDSGAIVNLTPMFSGRTMIFPHVVRMGDRGWAMFLSEDWVPKAIFRLWSADGLTWELLGDQPEIVKPERLMIKNVNGYYDAGADVLHGYLSVWHTQPDGKQNYDKYHATTRVFGPSDLPR